MAHVVSQAIQQDVLNLLLDLPPDQSPSIREMADRLEISTGSVQMALDALRAEDKVIWTQGRSRSYRANRGRGKWVWVSEETNQSVEVSDD